jgi:hypothetical protein
MNFTTKRQKLLAHLPWFVRSVAKAPGIRKISILGSITTEKLKPKDIDVNKLPHNLGSRISISR